MDHFDLRPIIPHSVWQLWISCKDCFTILHNERGQERHANYFNSFSERNIIVFRAIRSFGTKMVCALFTLILLSGFFINFTQEKGTKEYVKVFSVFFLRKNLFWGNFIFSSHFLIFDWVWLKGVRPLLLLDL